MIYHNAKDVPCIPGVYAIRNVFGDIKWIGQSINVGQRLSSHKYFRRRQLDSVLVWPCEDSKERIALEEAMIKKFRPMFNYVHNRGVRYLS